MTGEIKKIKKEWKNIIFNLVFALFTVLFPIIFYRSIIVTTALVGFVGIIGLTKWKSKITLAIFLFGAIWGSSAEMIAISYNVWSYSFTNFLNIPLWLFIVWGNASAFIYQTAIEFERLGFHK